MGIGHAMKRYYFCICYAWPLANSPVMAGNAFGETSSANRATLTRLSPLARDARETLYPAANGFSSSLHSLVGVGVSCLVQRGLLVQRMDGWSRSRLPSYRTCHDRDNGALFARVMQMKNRCIRNPSCSEPCLQSNNLHGRAFH
jgi:hypothetical protein